ncbi:hypothetical protein [Streptomyces europaeiscabiei]|uniref:hypothetical protein n=1 Tax=Streptomyces europaeiscabiei TaxID=146819 RepID=UPI000E67DC85|nr:hypothetical protein [Streptomyces europaeiscabiei]
MMKMMRRIRAACKHLLIFGVVPAYLWLVEQVGPHYSHDLLVAGLLMAAAAALLSPAWAPVAMGVIAMAWQNRRRL